MDVWEDICYRLPRPLTDHRTVGAGFPMDHDVPLPVTYRGNDGNTRHLGDGHQHVADLLCEGVRRHLIDIHRLEPRPP
ncbi:hypothetical protein GCM10009578_091810 [Streptomyces rhizosphaericus]